MNIPSDNLMRCDEACDLLDAYVDGELSHTERVNVESHLSECETCRALHDELRQLDVQLRRMIPSPEHESTVESLVAQLEAEERSSLGFQVSRPTAFQRGVSWFSCAAAAALLILIARPPTPRDPFVPIASQDPSIAIPPIAEVVAATGAVEYFTSAGQWQALDPMQPMTLPSGRRVRTNATSCEIQLAKQGTLRLNRDSEVVLHAEDRVELVQGQIWCRGPEMGDLLVEVSTVGADTPSDMMARCPSNSEMQWSVNAQATTCIPMQSTKVELRSGNFVCDIQPGKTLTVQRDLKSPAVYTSADSGREKSWQIPLLHQRGEDAKEELDRLLESVLSQIGQTKASFMYESQIRSLGPPGAAPLLAYARSPESRKKPDVRQRAARIGAEMADQSLVDALRKLSLDDDPLVREPVQRALARLANGPES